MDLFGLIQLQEESGLAGLVDQQEPPEIKEYKVIPESKDQAELVGQADQAEQVDLAGQD